MSQGQGHDREATTRLLLDRHHRDAFTVVAIDATMDVVLSPSPGRETAQNIVAGAACVIVLPLVLLRERQTIRRLRGRDNG